ncbi:MAG: beta-Ala-His dipeptidase [Eubacteriales bacterium]|nr:beta-Ala-His dipeptidase [Eubacteriales bacterium]
MPWNSLRKLYRAGKNIRSRTPEEKEPVVEPESMETQTEEIRAAEPLHDETEGMGKQTGNTLAEEPLPDETDAGEAILMSAGTEQFETVQDQTTQSGAAQTGAAGDRAAPGKEEEKTAMAEQITDAKETAEIAETGHAAEELAEPAEAAQETEVETESAEAAQEPEEHAEPDAETQKAEEQAEPAEDVFAYFRKICAIPHGSFHTEAISDYLEEFARAHNLSYIRDEAGNLIISRPASAGYENAAPIALQGHLDMVCEKKEGVVLDMDSEAITLVQDGEWLRADGTTLGGDNGIAVAMMMAVLVDKTLKCPPVECIFTVDEEVGLLGAHAIDLSVIKSRRLINLDSEEEGIITAGCAGGANRVCTIAGRRKEKKGQALEITISGLRGGHSGEMIGAGRANADLLLARLLYRLEAAGKYGIVSLFGGMRNNVIPREARAEILFTGKVSGRAVKTIAGMFAEEIRTEYGLTDPEIRIRAKWAGKNKDDKEKTALRKAMKDVGLDDGGEDKKQDVRIVFTRKDSMRMVRFLMALPNGVIEYSPQVPGMPRTSLNLGILRSMADGIQTHSMIRSNINSRTRMMEDRIQSLADGFGVRSETDESYPAWEMVEHSAFRGLAVGIYGKVTGKPAKVNVIHAGLECGILAAKVPGLECISIGPDMEGIHTPEERLSIPSTIRTFAYVKALLEACAEG